MKVHQSRQLTSDHSERGRQSGCLRQHGRQELRHAQSLGGGRPYWGWPSCGNVREASPPRTGEQHVQRPRGSADIAPYVIRRATTADLKWINTNDQEWPVYEHGEWGKGSGRTIEAAIEAAVADTMEE
jgi:hypothetical protein